MKTVKFSPRPIYHKAVFTSSAVKAGCRPDMRQIAKELATFLLSSGHIFQHEAIQASTFDGYEFRFSIYALKPERGLP